MGHHDKVWEVECPQCQVGHLEKARWPYQELYKGHLFTVPDAMCDVCDVCGYHEFDEAIMGLIGAMLEGATVYADDSDPTRSYRGLTASAEEDVPGKPPQPQV